MRLDKFLKVSRLIKRRTVANEACDAGRVLVNGKTAKASVKVKPGDVIEIQFGTRTVKVEVLDLQETTKKEDRKVYCDLKLSSHFTVIKAYNPSYISDVQSVGLKREVRRWKSRGSPKHISLW